MFSARTYFRQFELMNRALWPLHLLALGTGGLILVRMLRPRPAGARVAFALLGAAWVWVGWAYHLQRYAEINTGAPYFAWMFFLQAGLLGWMAWKAPGTALSGGMAVEGAAAIVLLALAGFPLLAPLAARGWWQAEVFALAPDPTAVATLGALLRWRAPWPLWLIPLLWCVVSGATLYALGSSQAWLLALAALSAVALALRTRAAARAGRDA